ncbi:MULTISPECIES: hypothetical protein [Enterococcus]|uniref:Uncharacterized protein n=1 Tax=Candidatus Enterococcus testudinis TaxID=1834191 RepID=A0A242A327_9ENTE|nr:MULTISPECIES: hypothetical protein [Enterococcus]MCD5202086.1 hypothetical protein [Enterococcus casseliflavus]MDT2955875.1 hypothetical protein [Enterococcus casseliflavus]MDT2959053.1 hypothetical protein [Enterococcus casseliflavus]OTN75447.1 hypothetical protein A5886_000517 [Enterococcus sp. 8G7_MSG3316]UQZ96381.1 hypothetical protein HLJ12_02375 [Enterococcus casseliflavus]
MNRKLKLIIALCVTVSALPSMVKALIALPIVAALVIEFDEYDYKNKFGGME